MKAHVNKAGFGKLLAKTTGPDSTDPRRKTWGGRRLSQLDAGEIALFLCINGWDVTLSSPNEKTLERRRKERDAAIRRDKREAARG